METKIEKLARALSKKYARQYHHNNCFDTNNHSFVFSNEEIELACIEMAKDILGIK